MAKDADSYRYLAESIRMHPKQDELKQMMENAGLDRCEYFNIVAGYCCCSSWLQILMLAKPLLASALETALSQYLALDEDAGLFLIAAGRQSDCHNH